MEKKVKWYKPVLIVLLCIVLFFGIVLLGARGYFRLSVKSYYKNSEKTFTIPDINKGFIPQGLHYEESVKKFYITGYTKDCSASPIYIVDKESKKTDKKVLLANSDGTAFTGHAGGLAVYKDFVFVAGGEEKEGRCVFVFSVNDINSAKDGETVTCKGRVNFSLSDDDYLGISFVTVNGDKLVVGEFYREQNYPTLPSHQWTTKGGDENKGLAVEFNLDQTKTDTFYIDNANPVKAYSLTSLVQGMVFDGDTVYLSTSYGLAFSHIYGYNLNKTNDGKDIAEDKKLTVLGKEISVFALDKTNIVYNEKIAPMSEEIVVVDNKMFVMSESASNKYIFGKFTGAKYCYATNLPR